MARVRAQINPALLRWARDGAGFDVATAAKKIGVSEDRIVAWEAGDEAPTIGQLRAAANVYKRPLAAFYLPEPPKEFRVATTDFRRLPGEVSGIYSPQLRLDVRSAEYHRSVALELLGELGERVPTEVLSLTVDLGENPEAAAERLRRFLGWPFDDRQRSRMAQNAFAFWRSSVERRGVLVFQLGDESTKEIRGFSLGYEPLPIIAVNRKDRPPARLFTLLHELCHIALHRGGFCDLEESAPRPPEEQRVEVFCNMVAAATLMPAEEVLSHSLVRDFRSGEWTLERLKGIGRTFGTSREAVLRRLLTLGRTSEAYYRKIREALAKEYEEEMNQEAGGAENYRRNVPRETLGQLGRSFVGLVFDGYNADRITLSDVSTFLGVRVKHIAKIESLLRAG